MADINVLVRQLVDYGMSKSLVKKEDETYTINRILDVLRVDEYEEPAGAPPAADLEGLLSDILDFAYENKAMEFDSIAYRDLMDTKIMGCLTPPPSDVIDVFRGLYKKSPREATDFYYDFSCNTDYIRRYRIAKDVKWTVDTEYGTLDVTINLSKPEKDPKAIAAAKNSKQSAYPKCQLCMENEGYAGRLDHPARNTLRIIPIEIGGERWGFQYSPYVYYNEHCIVFNSKHAPMKIDKSAFGKLFDFIKQFPHYFIGSNADLPIVGGSILSHEHFQGGRYEFAMERAKIREKAVIRGFEDVDAGVLNWPMSVIRISHEDDERLVELAARILDAWRGYTDEDAAIFAETDGEPHNTITPIARMRGTKFELDLVLRNNLTTDEHPLGLYHPHEELHHIKKENIGLIEVMGLAVLPARLKGEMGRLKEFMLAGKDIRSDKELEKHADWADAIMEKYGAIDEADMDDVIKNEIGIVFKKVLEHAGVYKNDEPGKEAFRRFISTL